MGSLIEPEAIGIAEQPVQVRVMECLLIEDRDIATYVLNQLRNVP